MGDVDYIYMVFPRDEKTGFKGMRKRWNRIRKKVLKKYGSKCMKCFCVNKVMHVDHIKPGSLHPELFFDFGNLQVLCDSCNKKKGNKQVVDYRPKNQPTNQPTNQTANQNSDNFEKSQPIKGKVWEI